MQSTPKIRLPKKDDEDTSDEERQWLNALEAGELDENGDVKKSKASSLLTTRQVRNCILFVSFQFIYQCLHLFTAAKIFVISPSSIDMVLR